MKSTSISQMKKMTAIPSSPENSFLVNRINELIVLNVKELEIEDLRLLIGQNIALDITIPLAITNLEINPFCEGDYYNGDLLKSVLSADSKFWPEHKEFKRHLQEIVRSSITKVKDQNLMEEVERSLEKLMLDFLHS